jgi:hypothetical protein
VVVRTCRNDPAALVLTRTVHPNVAEPTSATDRTLGGPEPLTGVAAEPERRQHRLVDRCCRISRVARPVSNASPDRQIF